MALQFMNQSLLASWIIDAWQNEFETEMDPADGQWFTTGPGNSKIGLFGGLTDKLASDLIYEESSKIFRPNQKTVDTAIHDNRNGLAPTGSVTLSYSYSDTTTSTHSTSNAIKTGLSESIKVSAKFGGTGVESTTTLSFDYTYSWSDSKAESKGKTQTFSQTVALNVPAGKVYQAQLMANTDELTIPYKALVHVSGKSEANFPGPVRGQKQWIVDAATLFSWINKYGSAGDQSASFGANPDRPGEGFFALNGSMTATNTTNFSAHVVDITDSFTGGSALAQASAPVVENLALSS